MIASRGVSSIRVFHRALGGASHKTWILKGTPLFFFCARRWSLVPGGCGKNGDPEGVQELTCDEKLIGRTGQKPGFGGGFSLA